MYLITLQAIDVADGAFDNNLSSNSPKRCQALISRLNRLHSAVKGSLVELLAGIFDVDNSFVFLSSGRLIERRPGTHRMSCYSLLTTHYSI